MRAVDVPEFLEGSDGKKTPFLYGLDRILNVEVLYKKAKVAAEVKKMAMNYD